MDRHRFDVDPDSDPTFHFDDDPDPDPDPTPNFTHVGKSYFLKLSFKAVPACLRCFTYLSR